MGKRRVESGKNGLNTADECHPDATTSKTFSPACLQSVSSLTRSGKDWHIQVLIVLIIIGAFLRFYHLGYNSLWLDEAVTSSYAQKSFLEIWGITSGGEFNPPFFYWVEHIMLLFGDREFVLRLIPAILGILTIPLFYLIGEELVDRNTGLIAAALLSFSPFHIYYSQEARAYTSALFFLSLALICYLRAHRSNDLKYWMFFGIFSAFAFWTHFYSLVIILALIIFELITQSRKIQENPSELKPVLVALAAFITLCVPLLIVTVRLFLIRTGTQPTFGAQGIKFINDSIWQIFGYDHVTEFILVALFIIGIIQLSRTGATTSLLPVTVIAITLLVSLVLSYKMPMLPKYLIFLLPFFYIGVAAAYKPVYERFSHRAVIYLFIIALFAINTPFLHEYYSDYCKSDWKGFAVELQNVTHDEDLIVVIPDYIRVPLDHYYSNVSDHTVEYGATTAGDLDELYSSRGSADIFIVSTDDIFAGDPTRRSVKWLQTNSTLIKINPKIANRITPKIRLYQINESSPLAWYNKGRALYKLGKYNESLQAYNKAIEADPKFASAWYHKGFALKALGRTEEAKAAFVKAAALAKIKASSEKR